MSPSGNLLSLLLQILDDEEEALAAAETEAQVVGEEAAKAARRIEPKPDGRSKDRVSRLQRKAREATNRAIALRLVIEGPPPIQVGPLPRPRACRLILNGVLERLHVTE